MSRALYRDGLPQRFARVVRENADRPAVLFDEGDAFSYRQLDESSNRVARFLAARGVKRGDRVAFRLEKGRAAYSIVLGCVKSGVAYFAVDPGTPEPRLAAMFAQCPPSLVFVESADRLGTAADKAVHCPAGSLDFCKDLDSAPLPEENGPRHSDAAYVMFTSGSTGTPKGAVMSHSNLLYFVDWAVNEYAFAPGERHTHLNPIYFDNSVFDMYSTFFSGGALVPFASSLLQDPFGVVEKIEKTRCEVFFSVPSMLIFLQTTKALEKGSMPSLRKVVFGGEGYPKTKLAELHAAIGGHARLINVYGPTECTCICSSYELGADDFKSLDGYPPIGSLTSPFSFVLLDGDRAVAPGEVGELCLGGPCVGLGYVNQPELTRRAFVQNPLNAAFDERLYRTGDLMRLDPADGKLWFVGRKDFQVKHQGFRIELEEIQHGLAKLEGVEEAAVIQAFENGASRLIGFVASGASPDPEALRRGVAKFVPKYMVPTRVFVLPRLPKNANGKTDRKKLLALHESGELLKEKA